MLLCWGIFLVARSLLVLSSILAHKDCAPEVRIFAFLAMDPFFPEFLLVEKTPSVKATNQYPLLFL